MNDPTIQDVDFDKNDGIAHHNEHDPYDCDNEGCENWQDCPCVFCSRRRAELIGDMPEEES